MERKPSKIGSYRLIEPLGEGGMGVVWRAVHQTSGRIVALKTVRVPNASLLSGLRREIHALARIRHPGVVEILDEGLHKGRPWYAMELLTGVSMRQWRRELVSDSQPTEIDSPTTRPSASADWWTRTVLADVSQIPTTPLNQPFPSQPAPSDAPNQGLGAWLKPILTLVRRLCVPLAFLHGEGLVHRDLKPDNVLLVPSPSSVVPTPVLVDFGLAASFGGEQSREALAIEHGAAGTIAYMAPEQMRGSLVDARADLYALGCILFELLTGHRPFEASSPRQVLMMHLQSPPVAPSSLVPGLPLALDELVLRLLRKAPAERIGHAEVVATTLAQLGAEPDPAFLGAPQPRPYLYRPGFAGREQPLGVLAQRLDRASNSEGGLLLVGGESGIGKTRLLLELSTQATAVGISVLAGEGRAVGGGPLEALRKPLQVLCDRCLEQGAAETARVFGARGAVLRAYEPEIRHLPGQETQPAVAELPTKEARLRLHLALQETLLATARDQSRGCLLLLDDLQWADELTVSFLEHLCKTNALGSASFLVVGAYRSEEVSAGLEGLLRFEGVQRLALGRLDEPAVAGMVGTMLALEPAPARFSRFLAGRSEGNPFFVAEYLRSAVESGLLWRDEEGDWQVAEPAAPASVEKDYEELELPRSLRELVGRRLASLSGEALQLAEAASVLGREADAAVLARMTGMEDAAWLAASAELLRRQVLEERGGRLRFVHEPLREAAYRGLRDERRRELHRAAAEVIEEAAVGSPESRAAALGRHWEQAGEPEQALPYYRIAARHERGRYAWQEAEVHARSVLRLTPEGPDRVRAQLELGLEVLEPQGALQPAIDEYQQALEEARRLSRPDLEGESLLALGNLYRIQGQMETAQVFLQAAIGLLTVTGQPELEAAARGTLGSVYRDQGNLDEARSLFERSLELRRQTGNRRHEGVAMSNLAALHHEQGHWDEARQLYLQAMDLHREARDRRFEGSALANLAMLETERSHYEEAGLLFEQALRILREIGDRRFEGFALGNLAILHHHQGRFEDARGLLEQALVIHRQIGEARMEGHVLSNLGILHFQQKLYSQAQTLFEQALPVLQRVGDRRALGYLLHGLGNVQMETGQAFEARARLEQSREALHEVGDQAEEGLALTSRSALERKAFGEFEPARRAIQAAMGCAMKIKSAYHQLLVLCEEGHLALAEGKSGRESLTAAEAAGVGLGVNPGTMPGDALARLRRAQAAFEEGGRNQLFRGQTVADLSEGLRRWLVESGQLGELEGSTG